MLPVVDEGSGSNQKEFLNRGLAFESRAWRKAGLHTVLLQQVFRQVGLLSDNNSHFHSFLLSVNLFFL